jgi:phospholipid/cholesterol/gamma-HCH transport system ATP-binding protein
MSTAPLLRMVGVSVRFGKQTVLSNVHLDVYPGETLALIGESGCGKSVTLKLIVGLLKPDEGDVYFEGRKLSDLNETELTAMRLRVGFLFQGAALFDSLNVFDNVAFGVRAKGGLGELAIRARVFEHLQEVGLSANVARKMPVELSGGMRKRVGLARAMALQPDVMLYDEPTTGLDPIMTDVINELILRTRTLHPVTSVVVTHEMRTVQKVADRVVMLYPRARLAPSDSQVLYDGTAAGLLQATDPRVPQFVLGEARDRMNELKAELSGV